MTLYQFLSIIGPIIGGFLGVGGVGAYYSYKSSKPKTFAEAQKINAEVVLTFADGWKAYAEKLERRSEDLDVRLHSNEEDIYKLQQAIRDQDEKNRRTLKEKDDQIYDLQAKNRTLERRVSDMELELSKYKQAAS